MARPTVKIAIGSEFDPRGFIASQRALAQTRTTAVLTSKTMEGSFLRAGIVLDRLGKRLMTNGQMLTSRFTLPLGLAAAASVKLAVDFESAMVKVRTLAGASDAEIQSLSRSLLEMAPAVGQAPLELADSLFYVRSAGYKGAQALDMVKLSAEAASLKLGEAKYVALALTHAMNAYPHGAITATQAMDQLKVGATKGVMVTEDLAKSLGQILPVAANVKVSFGQVIAGIAALSREGMSASESETALTQMLVNLLKPTQQGADMLKTLHLSYTLIRDDIAKRGLLPALMNLRRALDDTENAGESAAKIFSRRGLVSFLTLTGPAAQRNAKIFNDVANSAGNMTKAWKYAEANDPSLLLKKVVAGLKATGIEIGAALLPTVLRLGKAVAGLCGWFARQDNVTQDIILSLGLALAAAGPLETAFGALAWTGGQLCTGFGKLALMIRTGTTAVGTESTGLLALAGVEEGTTMATVAMTAAMAGATLGIGVLGFAVYEGIKLFGDWKRAEQQAKQAHQDFINNLDAANSHLKETGSQYRVTVDAAGNVVTVYKNTTREINKEIGALRTLYALRENPPGRDRGGQQTDASGRTAGAVFAMEAQAHHGAATLELQALQRSLADYASQFDQAQAKYGPQSKQALVLADAMQEVAHRVDEARLNVQSYYDAWRNPPKHITFKGPESDAHLFSRIMAREGANARRSWALTFMPPGLGNEGKTFMAKILLGIASQKTKIGTSGRDAAVTAIQGWEAVSPTQSGIDTACGLANGLSGKEATQKVWDAATGLGATALKALAQKLENQSPSHAMFRHGRYAGLGLAAGMDSSLAEIGAAGRRMAAMAMNPFGNLSMPTAFGYSGASISTPTSASGRSIVVSAGAVQVSVSVGSASAGELPKIKQTVRDAVNEALSGIVQQMGAA